MTREEYVEKIDAKLRALIPDGTAYAREKRAETLEYASEQVLGGLRVHDIAEAAALPLTDLEKLWRAIDGIVDAH